MRNRTLLLAALLAAAWPVAPVRSGTREDLERMQRELASLGERVRTLEVQSAALKQGLQELAATVEALERSAQTADLRADLSEIRRRIEAMQARLDALEARPEAAVPPSPVPSAAAGQETGPPGGSPPPPPEAGAGTAPVRGPEELYNQAYHDYLQGRYDLALSEFQRFLEAFPGDPRAGHCQYWLGECLYSQKKYREAKAAFQMVLERYPSSPKVPAARLKLGFTHLALDETAQGVTALKILVQTAPESEEAALAKERLKRLQEP